MQISPNTDKVLHEKLPIDNDEKVIAIYKHHWFAYAGSWMLTAVVVIILVVVAALLTSVDSSGTIGQYRAPILAGVSLFGLLIIMGGMLPVYLRSREQLVLTDEALLRVLQPTLFSNKVDQLGLQHLADISVQQGFFGNMFNFGHVLIETPGEQKTNYDFFWVANPRAVAREITAAHEEFDAALQAGRLPTSMGTPQLQAPTIDPQEFQQFLEFQQMQKMQQQQQGGTNPPAAAPQDPPANNQPSDQVPPPQNEANPYGQQPQKNQQQ